MITPQSEIETLMLFHFDVALEDFIGFGTLTRITTLELATRDAKSVKALFEEYTVPRATGEAVYGQHRSVRPAKLYSLRWAGGA